MKVTTKKLTSLFLLLLILSINLTYAVSISSYYVTGEDGLENIISSYDTVTINAHVPLSAASDATNASQRTVVITNQHTGDYVSFNSCTHSFGDSFYECTYTQSAQDYTSRDYTSNQLIGFTDSSGNIIEQHTLAFYSDAAAPVINTFTAQQDGPNVSVNFAVTDSIDSYGAFANVCSGFKEVIIKLDNSPLSTYTLNESSCSKTYTGISVPTPADTDGLHSVQIQIIDNVGLVSEQRGYDVVFDAIPPTVNNVRFVSGIIDPVTDVSPFGEDVRVKLETTDAETVQVSVDNQAEGVPIEKTTTCSSSGECYTEEFTLIDHRDYTITVVAKDAAGNTNTQTITRTIAEDDQSDTVLSLRTNISQDGVYYLSDNSKATVIIQASGSGYSKEQIALTVDGFAYAPTNCSIATGSSWECVWDPVDVSQLGSDLEKSVDLQITGEGGVGLAMDDAGNEIYIDTTSVSYIYDDLAPQNLAHTDIIPYGAGFDYSFPVSYSDLNFNVTYDDISPVTIYVNASELGKTDLVSYDCSTGDCLISTGAIGPGPYNNRMEIRVVDAVGNEAILNSELVEVLMTNYSDNTSAFEHDLSLSPSSLEISSAEYFGQKAFADVLIRAANGGVLQADLVGCRNVDDEDLSDTSDTLDFVTSLLNNTNARGDLSYVGSFEILDTLYNDDGSASLLFTVDFKKKPIEQETIAFYCDIDVAGTWGNQFVPLETESVLLQFSTYEFSLGTLPDNYEQDVADAKATAEDHISSQLGWLRQLMDIAVLLCQLWSVYELISPVLENPGEITKVLGLNLLATPATAPAGAAALEAGTRVSCTGGAAKVSGDEVIKFSMKAACSLVTCDGSLMGGILGSMNVPGFGDGFWEGTGSSVENGVLSNIGTLGDRVTTDSNGNEAFNPLYTEASANSENLVSSIINLCIPGILYNLEKDRQIECKYAYCLETEVPAGIPKEACDAQRSYAKCAYVTGGIVDFLLNTLPIVSLINQLREMLSDPLGAVGFAFGVACAVSKCIEFPEFPCTVVKFTQMIGKVMGIIKLVTDIISFFDEEEQLDYCSKIGLEESSLF